MTGGLTDLEVFTSGSLIPGYLTLGIWKVIDAACAATIPGLDFPYFHNFLFSLSVRRDAWRGVSFSKNSKDLFTLQFR